MSNTKSNLAEIALCSLFTAIICILAQISVPTPLGMPITLQILGVSLCGYLLGVKKAVVSVLAYIFLGVVGIPVFAGFKGGLHTLFSVTGGFIFGFLAVAFFCGLAKRTNKKVLKISFSAAGLVICHFLGVLQLAVISKTDILSALVTASLPFILKDILLLIAAFFITKALSKRFKLQDI